MSGDCFPILPALVSIKGNEIVQMNDSSGFFNMYYMQDAKEVFIPPVYVLPHLCLSVLMIREFMLLRIDYNEWVGSPARLYLGLRLMQKVFSAHGKSWKSTFAAGRI